MTKAVTSWRLTWRVSWGAKQSEVLERQHMKQMKAFTGKWRIAEMEVWDQGYVDTEVPGYIRIG